MCRTQFVLALTALYVGLAYSWDVAISAGDLLEFYTDGTKTGTVRFRSHNLATIVYDELHNMMLFVDKQSDYDAICGYDLSYKDTRCFVKRYGGNIHGLAFDPESGLLFFTDTNERSINWISLKPGYNYNDYGNLLIKMDDRTPTDIAVDSCRGYIYWMNKNTSYYHMERSRFNGLERMDTYKRSVDLFSFALDLKTQKMYYFDGSYSNKYLNKMDLNSVIWEVSSEEEIMFTFYDLYSDNEKLTVSEDYMYWINGSESYKTVWRRPKNSGYLNLKEFSTFYNEGSLGIATNYKIKEQIKGLEVCNTPSRLIPTITLANSSLNTQRSSQERCQLNACHGHCLNNGTCSLNETSEPVCLCKGNYVGERCEVSSCLNYCIQGSCGFNDEGLPTCRCDAGYSGERCEVLACHGYCQNNGTCFLNETSEPVCQCKENYMGERCEVSSCLNYCIQGSCSFNDEGLPTCRCNAGYSGKRCEVFACDEFCLNNGTCSLNNKNEPVCQCQGNYVGERCEVSDCRNYCIQGICSFNDVGLPKCSCNTGYSGKRCEVFACHGYCLNNGDCFLNEDDEPFCRCVGNHEGSRCEAVKNVDLTFNNSSTYYSAERNISLVDLLSKWRKSPAKISVFVEV